MQFKETPLRGAYLIELDRHFDHRGFFARTFCQREFKEHGLSGEMVQTNVSYSTERGTLRGMHYQTVPAEEAKLIRCTGGSIFDVIVDVRPTSDQFMQWFGAALSARNYRMLYVPEGFAHGFLTLEPESEVVYQVSQFYTPGHERGIRYDDPAIGIEWPESVRVISDKDAAWPDFEPAGILQR